MTGKICAKSWMLTTSSVVAAMVLLSNRASATDAPANAIDQGTALTEVVVTAQKRTERLQDVPVPVTVLEPSTLAEQNQTRLQDYFATVPGLNYTNGASGFQNLAIRGITNIGSNGTSNPTVAVTIDDVPNGSSSGLAYAANQYPDIDPSDLERIEVLRGPQGTLYGASSIGGLLKFVTVDPSTSGFSGRVQVLGDDVDHGGDGYGVRGAVNVPLSDTFAIRASAFTRRDPGYIANVTTGQHENNQVDVSGGRFSALWRPSDAFSIKFSAMQQNTNGDGDGMVDTVTNNLLQPLFGGLTEARMNGTGGYSSDNGLYAVNVAAKLGSVDLVSISSYGDTKYKDIADCTASLGFLMEPPYGPFSVSGCSFTNDFDTKKYTQEIRLSSTAGHLIDWLVGGFFTRENTAADQDFFANDPSTGERVGLYGDFNFPTTVTESALFADLTVHFTDRFDMQFGARESHNVQTYRETDTGPGIPTFYGVSGPLSFSIDTTGNAFTYLLTPRFKISPDLMVYARVASGYRLGGPNIEETSPGVPSTFEPDKDTNYELGIKGNLFDHAFSFDASAYYIDWKNLQISVENTAFIGYTANAGGAKSQGIELSLQGRPTAGLTISAVASINDAELTELPHQSATSPGSTLIANPGDRLPFSSRFSGNLGVDQDIPLPGNWTGFIGGSLSYVSAREGNYVASLGQQRIRLPAYGDTNVHIGARTQSWTINAFVNNALDRLGIVGGASGPPFSAIYIQPRTVGMSVAKSF